MDCRLVIKERKEGVKKAIILEEVAPGVVSVTGSGDLPFILQCIGALIEAAEEITGIEAAKSKGGIKGED